MFNSSRDLFYVVFFLIHNVACSLVCKYYYLNRWYWDWVIVFVAPCRRTQCDIEMKNNNKSAVPLVFYSFCLACTVLCHGWIVNTLYIFLNCNANRIFIIPHGLIIGIRFDLCTISTIPNVVKNIYDTIAKNNILKLFLFTSVFWFCLYYSVLHCITLFPNVFNKVSSIIWLVLTKSQSDDKTLCL